MNPYVKTYLLRGLIFSGLGPVVLAIVFLILQLSGTTVSINGYEIALGIITTYIIAFVHAGSTTFPQIEKWSKVKAMFFQFVSLYSVYTIGYLINGWLKFNWVVFTIYTSVFVGGFLLVWLIVVLSIKSVTKKLNSKLSNE